MNKFKKKFEAAIGELQFLSDAIDEGECNKIVTLICSNRFEKIVGFGAGRMGYSLRAFIMRLSHIGMQSYMIGDTNFPRINSKTLVIVNSSSGETPTSVLYAEQAKEAGAYILTVTQKKKSTLASISDIVFQYPNIFSNQIMKTLPEQFTFLLFDILSELIIEELEFDKLKISRNHSISE